MSSVLSRCSHLTLRGLYLALACLFSSSPTFAAESLEAEIYMAQVHESEWAFKGSPALCELEHEIPQFGHARFQRLAGESLSFRIDTYQPIPEKIEGVLREVSPEWEHNDPDPLEQMVVIKSGQRPVALDRRPAGWLLSSLAKGQIGSFDLLDWNDSRKQVHIRLSPVKFQRPYREFKQCLKKQSGSGFEALRRTTVNFALDVHELDAEAQEILEDLADYIAADDRVSTVRISGHADDQGKPRYNLRLSAKRAKRVSEFLAGKGIELSRISTRHYGESRPKIRKRTEVARAANRRAEIELVRGK
ncbi:MAG: OmpA family protein [Candidatus Thiodiazotropha sp. (ex Monitilora ramsayi)]|nr:OmpA family protein [Candidatus Thiodiazotropha sp. (ex Monitilora ramsayi)]